MLLIHGAPVSVDWNLYIVSSLAPVVRKQGITRLEDSIHDT